MKRKTYLILGILFLSFNLFSQSLTINDLFSIAPNNPDFIGVVSKADYFTLNIDVLENINNQKPKDIVLSFPLDGQEITLTLKQHQIVSNDFIVRTSAGTTVDYQAGLHYSGTVSGNDINGKTMAAVSIFDNYMMAVFAFGADNYVIGKLYGNRHNENTENQYILYKERDLLIQNPFHCGAADLPIVNYPTHEEISYNKNPLDKVVRVYVEADNTLYLNNSSSTTNTTNYIMSIWNVLNTLYANEQINTVISQLYIWTSADTYPSDDSGNALDAFGAQLNNNFNGDLAHLMSADPTGGGVAWLDVLCANDLRYAYSGNLGDYEAFPTYSWSVEVITHEMGHNLGSPHTQSCSWGTNNNAALDDCYPTEGGCAPGPTPTNGGTIMSYCHLGNTGINFANGFGPEPGNLIRSKVDNASCLQSANLPCGNAQILACGQTASGNTTGLTNHVSTYSCNTNAYTGGEQVWYITTTTTAEITFTLSSSNSNLRAILINSCNENTCNTIFSNTFTLTNASPGSYYIVIDGLNGAGAAYTLSATCLNLPCNNVTTLNCGSSVSSTTSGISNGGNVYNCTSTLMKGGEKIYNLVTNIGDAVTLTFSGNTNLKAFLASSCSSSSCIAEIVGTYNFVATGTSYYIIVDGKFAAGGTFTLSSNCVPNCNVAGSTNYEFINSVQLGTINNVSGNNNGFGDFSSMNTLVMPNMQVPFSIAAGFVSGAYDENWRIWVDLNNDNDFIDANELLYESPAAAQSISGNISIPNGISIGTHKIKVGMKYGGLPDACTSNTYDGEAELYSINVVQCITPQASTSLPQSATNQIVFWDAIPGASKYQIRFRAVGTSTYTTMTVTGVNYKLLTSLLSNTAYEYNVRSYCTNSSSYSAYSATFNFTTNATTGTCQSPTSSIATILSTTSAKVYWNQVPTATKYQIRYRVLGTTTWTTKNATVASYSLTGLLTGNTYEYQIRSYCGSAFIAWNTLTFQFTLPNAVALVSFTNTNIEDEVNPIGLLVYPNPTKDNLTIWVDNADNFIYEILNINGQVIQKGTLETESTTVNTDQLLPGIYMIQVKDDYTGLREIIRFIKQ